MSLPTLRSFVEVYRCRSISGAARNLGLTQPAVSGHIASLETQLGRTLFERQARGVAATAFAHDLAAQVGDSLDRAEQALAQARARSSRITGTVHIAGPAELMAERVAPALRALQSAGLDLRIHLGGKSSLYDNLVSGAVDLAFTASTPRTSLLDTAHLGSETLWAVASPDTANRIKAARDLGAALSSEPLLAYDTDRPLVRDWLVQNRLSVDAFAPAITAPDLRMLRALLELGAGWSVIPDYLCAKAIADGTLIHIPAPRTEPANPIHLTWIKSALRHPRVAFAREVLLDQWSRSA